MTSPYSSVTAPPVVETYFPLSSIKRTNCPCDTADGVRDQRLDARRGERLLRDVQSELPRRRRHRSGQRLGVARQLLLDRALDIDVGVQLIDEVDAERLLNILVLENLVAGVRHLVRVQHRALNPVRGDRDDQQHRRDHDQRPHQHAVTPLGLRRGRRGALRWGGVGLVGHYWRIGRKRRRGIAGVRAHAHKGTRCGESGARTPTRVLAERPTPLEPEAAPRERLTGSVRRPRRGRAASPSPGGWRRPRRRGPAWRRSR